MSNTIEDGTGDSYKAQVDSKHRLHVASDSSSSLDAAINAGRYFGVNTGYITLTSASPSSVFYIRSDSTKKFFLKTFRLAVGPSTGGTSPLKIALKPNTTAGTLLSAGTATSVLNLNFSSGEQFDGESLKGVEGSTATGAPAQNDFLIPMTIADGVIYDKDLEAVLTKGDSLALEITPPTGNTSMEIQLLVTGYYLDEAAINE